MSDLLIPLRELTFADVEREVYTVKECDIGFNVINPAIAKLLARQYSDRLNMLAREIREVNEQNGWNVLRPEQWVDTYKIPAILALIHSEVSEALEAFRADDKENFAEELSDIIIRVLDCAAGLEIDMDSTIKAKIAKNRTRGFHHGGKRV